MAALRQVATSRPFDSSGRFLLAGSADDPTLLIQEALRRAAT